MCIRDRKDMPDLIWRDPYSLICDFQTDLFTLFAHSDFDLGFRGGLLAQCLGLHGIAHEIEKYLLQSGFIGFDPAVVFDADQQLSRFGKQQLVDFKRLSDNGAQVLPIRRQLQLLIKEDTFLKWKSAERLIECNRWTQALA